MIFYKLYHKDANIAGGHWVEYLSHSRDAAIYRTGSYLWAIEEAEHLAKVHDRVMISRIDTEETDGTEE